MKLAGSPLVTHALIADSGRARLIQVTGPRRHRVLEQEETFERPSAHVPAHELTTDRTGRARLPADLQRLIAREISGDYVRADHDRILQLIDSRED